MESMIHKIKKDSRTGQECEAACAECNRETFHEILASLDVQGDVADGDIRYWESHDVIQCKGCKSLSFRKVQTNTENEDYNEETQEHYLVPYT